jgi:selenocysteine lyase/cysteine desulfurase
MTTKELRDELLVSGWPVVVSRFSSSVEFPLVNLDWNATSKPLKSIETQVQEMAWKRYGNPHSCGTLTALTSGDLMEECAQSILGNLGVDRQSHSIAYGGEGSSFWLQGLARGLFSHCDSVISVQEELHTSLVRPFLDQGYRLYRSKTVSWVTKFKEMMRDSKSVILLITLMSHLTGDEFDCRDLELLKATHDNQVIIIVDATSYLAHRKRLPPNLVFDHLVFSGHKFPGGPGSPGCIVSKLGQEKGLHDTMGTPNVTGICRLALATRLRTRLMTEEDKNVDALIKELETFFSTTQEVKTRFLLHKWNNDPTSRKAPVFCFSVEMVDRGVFIHPQVVAMILLNAYGIQIRAGGHCADTVLSRLGVWGELQDLDLTQYPIMLPSVCRISFPRYLVSREWVDDLKVKMTDFLRCARFFLRCFTPSFQGWSFNEHFLMLGKRPVTQTEETKRECSSCPHSSKAYYRSNPLPAKTDKEEFGALLYAKISGPITLNIDFSPRKASEHEMLAGNPFRWFALPNESKIAEEEL